MSNLPEIYKKHDTDTEARKASFSVNMATVFGKCMKDMELDEQGKKAILVSAKLHLEMGSTEFKFLVN